MALDRIRRDRPPRNILNTDDARTAADMGLYTAGQTAPHVGANAGVDGELPVFGELRTISQTIRSVGGAGAGIHRPEGDGPSGLRRVLKRGSHQLARPINPISTGTSTTRISVTSIATANASPSPNSRVAVSRVNPNDPKRTTTARAWGHDDRVAAGVQAVPGRRERAPRRPLR
jgi:hypothetical protein